MKTDKKQTENNISPYRQERLEKSKNHKIFTLVDNKKDIHQRINAIIEALQEKPRDFTFLVNWIASNNYITGTILDYMIEIEIVDIEHGLYKLNDFGIVRWQNMS